MSSSLGSIPMAKTSIKRKDPMAHGMRLISPVARSSLWRVIVSVLVFPVAIVALTDPIRVLDYYNDLRTVTVHPSRLGLYSCDGDSAAELTDVASVQNARCVQLKAAQIEGRITYHQSEPAFEHLARLVNAEREVKLWYSSRPVRTLFTSLGTLRAVREGETYHVDIVNTLLHRHRVAAQSAMLGAAILLGVIPVLMWRPVATYLNRYRSREPQQASRP